LRHLRVLVTGCGRSGTRYLSFVLRRLGLDVGHERVGRDGVISWALAVVDDEPPWGPSGRDLSFDIVLHQVREPLRVMNSAATFKDESWRFIARHVPCPATAPLPLRAAAYWYHWNVAAERNASLTYRIEDLPRALPEICRLLDVAYDPAVLQRVPENVNTRSAGRLFHFAEEGSERLRLEMPAWARRTITRPSAATPVTFGFDDVRALDAALCDLVVEKARAYGYVL
jgi:hypothetical protein